MVDWLLTVDSPLGFNAVYAKLAVSPDEFDSSFDLATRWDNLLIKSMLNHWIPDYPTTCMRHGPMTCEHALRASGKIKSLWQN
jgi:hypothetical protein